jgi:hypothetical protein
VSGHRTARVLVYTHRWLGMALGVLFIVWFASGIVMMYARMPALDPLERLARLPAINAPSIRVPPPALPAGAGLAITSLEGRPVYRITGARMQFVFADTGDAVPPVDREQALRIARTFAGPPAIRYDVRLTDADQWTFDVRRLMPMHRIAVDDAAGTELYVTENGGDVVARTTASGRRWGWWGAVLHWLYFTPLRRNATLWSNAVIYVSLAGTVMCAAGLLWGAWRLAPARRYRLRDHYQWTPYAKSIRWHHYLGLAFGATAMMWVFSGMLSMDPWDWNPGTAPTRDQRERLAGGPIAAGDLSVARIRRAVAAFMPRMPKEVELLRFRGRSYAVAAEGIVSLDQPHLGAADQLPPDLVVGGAGDAMPDIAIDGMHWMDEYDAYYYDRGGRKSLPVLRVRYGDSRRTWLYFDPRRGSIARKEERLSRLNRWLYHGFHSFDFPFLYYRRPLWDVVVLVLSAGGLLLAATTLAASWRRARRRVRRALRSMTRRLPSVILAIGLVAGCARLEQAFAGQHDAVDVALFCGGERVGGGVEHQPRIRHPLFLIARPAGHHQQVRRLGQHQRLCFQQAPLVVGFRRPRLDVEQRVGRGVDDPDHQLAHRADVTRGRPRRGRGLGECRHGNGKHGDGLHRRRV